MQHWFVYYRLDRAAAAEVEPRLRRMLSALAADCGVRARLMRRADRAAGEVTLLEAYDGIDQPESFGRALGAAVQGAGLPASLLAQRRTERFEDI